MPRLTILLPAIALLPVASVAQAEQRSPAQQLAHILTGRTAGKPVECIDLTEVSAIEILPGIGIVYRLNNGTVMVNRPADADFLHREDILVTDMSTSRICNIDIVRLVDSGTRMPVGSINLAKFVPYRRNSK